MKRIRTLCTVHNQNNVIALLLTKVSLLQYTYKIIGLNIFVRIRANTVQSRLFCALKKFTKIFYILNLYALFLFALL